MVQHLANLLRRFGHLEKTMGFCVDMEHARLVARLLRDEFGPETGLDNYAVPIIAEEGEELMERIREAKRLREEAKQDAERLWQAVLAETFPRPEVLSAAIFCSVCSHRGRQSMLRFA